ncbi:hypothetical protein GCM10018966_103420 [Streptomyces yanii]
MAGSRLDAELGVDVVVVALPQHGLSGLVHGGDAVLEDVCHPGAGAGPVSVGRVPVVEVGA